MSSWAVDGLGPRAGWASVLLIVFGLTTSCCLTACGGEKTPSAPDPESVLQAISPADPAKFPSLQETKHWRNPYLVIRPQSVGLLTGVAANEEQIVKPEEVLKTLAQLPASAWPYGRAVAVLVDAKPTSSEQDKIALRRNRGLVAGELQSAHVAINWIPSS
ncbi:MAG: hypothetical protein ABSE28_03220 [Candidatus Sulfotelmatobacter sp.]